MEKISSLLKQYQKENHYTYQKMANVLKMSKSTVYAYTNSLRNPTMKSIQNIASALDLSVSGLLDETMVSEQEITFLKHLRSRKKLYQFLLEKPNEKIKFLENTFFKKE